MRPQAKRNKNILLFDEWLFLDLLMAGQVRRAGQLC